MCFLWSCILELLNTLNLCLKLSCVPFFITFWELIYKCSGLLSHSTSFVIFFIAGSYTQVQWYQNAMNIILLVKKDLHELNIPIYVSYIYPVLGQWLKFSQCPCLSSRLFSQFCTYTIFWPVIKCIGIPTFTCT
jgi:hypothetical protein